MTEPDNNTNPTFIEQLTLQVAVQIIKHISSGLYRSAGSALKELISNSFDADATEAVIKVVVTNSKNSLKVTRFVVEDNGKGMSLDDLRFTFTHVGGSRKQGGIVKEPKTDSGRPIIGRLGIGMLAIASACKSFKVVTKQKDLNKEYTANVSLEFFDKLNELIETIDKFSIGNVELSEREVHDNTSYTRVEIEKFTPPFMENVNDGLSASFFIKESKHEQVEDEEYFKRFLRHIDDDKFKNRLINLQPLDLALAQLALMSPCRYLSDGPVRSRIETSDRKIYKVEGADDPALMRIKEQLIDYNFAIRCEIFNDSETRSKLRNRFSLFKPLLYPSERDLEKWRSYEDLAEHLKPQVAVLPTIVTEVPTPEGSTRTSMTAYTYHQNARINPREFRGILFRVYSVGIGQEFADDYRYYSNDPVTLQQTFIEVYLDEGFQSIVNLDRESLYQGSNLFRHAHNVLKMYLKGIDIGIDSDATLDDFTTLKLGATAPPSGPDYDAAVARKREQAKVQFEESFILAEKKALSSIDPKNVGVIDKIKRSKPSARRVGIYRKRLDDVMRKEVIERVKADELVVKRVGSHNIAKVSLDNKRAIISIPEYKGTRRKLWDAIAILVALHIKDDKQRSEAMSFLWKIYLASEDTE